MTARRSLRAAGLPVVMLALAPAGAIAARAHSAAAPSAPVIKEPFESAPLPCEGSPSNRTTVQQEGCAEQQILKTDAKINALNKSIFTLLSATQKKQFITANTAWLAYRHADCVSMQMYEGGSEGPVIYAQCVAERNAQRIKNLTAFERDLKANAGT